MKIGSKPKGKVTVLRGRTLEDFQEDFPPTAISQFLADRPTRSGNPVLRHPQGQLVSVGVLASEALKQGQPGVKDAGEGRLEVDFTKLGKVKLGRSQGVLTFTS